MPPLDPGSFPFSRRSFLKLGAALPLSLVLPGCTDRHREPALTGHASHSLPARDRVPDPENVFFSVQLPGKTPIRLAGHFWFNAEARKSGTRCPAIVEFVPYRRRDGTLIADSKMYPWFAYNE